MFNSLKFKVILFGFIFTFFSSFGQSYFLGLFNSSIREALSITHGQFGSIYASATLCSSLLLIWVGKKIDDVNIFKFAFFVIILLSFACFFFSRITSVFLLFIAIFLMRFSGQGMMSHTASKTISREDNDENIKEVEIKQWKRREVIKDYRFYIISSNMLAMPWIFTGFAVFQSFVQTSKGWGPYVIAQSFMSYSVLSVLTLFLSGFLIDKFTSRKLLIYMNIPLLLSVIVLFFFDTPITAFIFLGLVGISNGFANILGSSTWAELYGVKYLGSIKALTTALMVFATAFGTALFGYLIDIGFTVGDIAVVSGTYIFISLILLFLVRKKLNPVII